MTGGAQTAAVEAQRKDDEEKLALGIYDKARNAESDRPIDWFEACRGRVLIARCKPPVFSFECRLDNLAVPAAGIGRTPKYAEQVRGKFDHQ